MLLQFGVGNPDPDPGCADPASMRWMATDFRLFQVPLEIDSIARDRGTESGLSTFSGTNMRRNSRGLWVREQGAKLLSRWLTVVGVQFPQISPGLQSLSSRSKSLSSNHHAYRRRGDGSGPMTRIVSRFAAKTGRVGRSWRFCPKVTASPPSTTRMICSRPRTGPTFCAIQCCGGAQREVTAFRSSSMSHVDRTWGGTVLPTLVLLFPHYSPQKVHFNSLMHRFPSVWWRVGSATTGSILNRFPTGKWSSLREGTISVGESKPG